MSLSRWVRLSATRTDMAACLGTARETALLIAHIPCSCPSPSLAAGTTVSDRISAPSRAGVCAATTHFVAGRQRTDPLEQLTPAASLAQLSVAAAISDKLARRVLALAPAGQRPAVRQARQQLTKAKAWSRANASGTCSSQTLVK